MKKLLWLVLLVLSVVLDQVTLTVGDICTPTSAGNSSVDDVPAINEALWRCGYDGGTILIQGGKTYMIRSPLDFQYCRGCQFQIDGTLKVSDDLDDWEGQTAIFTLTNLAGVTVHSSKGLGLIDGSGQAFWDHFASNKTYRRPVLMQISNSANINFTNFKLKDAPFWFFYVTDQSTNIMFSDLVLSAVSTSHNKPANTDGFDTDDCSQVTINNIHVTNGDDCVSFKNGSSDITVNNITCVGSHGLSVGSLGSDHGRSYIVKNIYVSNATMINSSAATSIKLYPGGPSHGTVVVNNVTYENIKVENCDYAFQLDTCYESDPTICKQNPSAAKLSNIHHIDVTGKTSKKYDPVVAKIDCPPTGTCNLTFRQWNIVAPSGNSTVLCSNYEHPSGITCTPEIFD